MNIQLILALIAGFFLLVMTILDIRKKSMPSVLTTTCIFILTTLAIYNQSSGFYYGILAGIFALLLYEVGYVGGLADIKASIIIGLLITSLAQFLVFMLAISIVGFIYKFTILKLPTCNKKQTDEVPFLPVFFIAYLILIGYNYLI